MLIDATHAEETRVVVVDGNKVEEFDFETQSRRQLAGNIYLAKVTRVEPSLQAAFIDYGGNRHGFLAFNEIHPDYYQIPVADRLALIAEEVIKVRQILLIQVVKEERGNKGAALTTYLSLAGRYCVLMPNTARGGGISRKITNAADRKKLKAITNEMSVPEGAGLIIRTAGSQRTKTEIKRDYEYLQRLWEQIRELTLKSTAPAQIYEEGNLIKRSIRDLYSKEIDEVIVEGEGGYRTAKDFMKMIMPSHAKNVKHYQEQMPLFARHQVESYLSGMFNPTVQLPSGGYIVIGITEALVAIDVNSGRATKEGSIEQTATKTNLEAAAEVARQLRLRDLAGLIVIDFIDMDERRNNAAVEKMMKDKLKTDRARIQVGRISGFGLMEMSRQRLRPGMLESTTQMCSHCHGTGLLRSDDNVALGILRQLEEEGVRGRSKEVLVKAPIAISNFLMNQKREHVAQIEARYGLSVRVEGDPHMISPDFALEKFKTASRVVAEVELAAVISSDTAVMADVEETVEEAETQTSQDQASTTALEQADGEAQPKKRRRRRRRRRGNGGGENADAQQQDDQAEAASNKDAPADAADAAKAESDAPMAEENVSAETATKPKRTRTRRKKAEDQPAAEKADDKVADMDAPAEKPKRTRSRAKKPVEAAPEVATDVAADEAPVEKPKRATRSRKKPAPKAAETTPDVVEAVAEPAPEAAPETKSEKPKRVRKTTSKPAPVDAETPAEPEPKKDEVKPKKRGWWSLGGG
ncbi:UNVERIFIED_CONTAM: hypothetical protein GTU68_029846 [Idotea baltica]|nr:hypothetical protein [Idotea baltica]